MSTSAIFLSLLQMSLKHRRAPYWSYSFSDLPAVRVPATHHMLEMPAHCKTSELVTLSCRVGHLVLPSWSPCLAELVTLSCRVGHLVLPSWSPCLAELVTLSCRVVHLVLPSWSPCLAELVTLSCRVGHLVLPSWSPCLAELDTLDMQRASEAPQMITVQPLSWTYGGRFTTTK